jgi:hypothetical protein
MFSKAVVSSARFMKMPVDSQNLYFHLGMAADDDGVVEAWSILKTTGSAEDNLKVLASKGFIKVLNEDLVSYILDWNEHNMMRSDRLTPSAYRELLVQVMPDIELVDPKPRADRPARLGRPGDNRGTAQDRVGEDRLLSAPEDGRRVVPDFVGEGESELVESKRSTAKYPHALEVFSWFPRPQKSWEAQRNVQEREYAEFLYARGEESVKKMLRYVDEWEGNEDFKYVVTKPSDLEKKWEDLRKYGKRNS